MKKLKEPEIDPDSMIGQAVTAMIGTIVGLTLLDEMIKQMHLARFFKEEDYKLFNVRM